MKAQALPVIFRSFSSFLFSWGLGSFLFAGTFFFMGCAAKEVPPNSLGENYEQLFRKIELEPNSSDSMKKMQDLILQFEGTKYASFAQLALAELLMGQLSESYNRAEDFDYIQSYFSIFLLRNSQHPLAPYILKRLLEMSYIRSRYGIFVYGTNPKPYQDMLAMAKNSRLIYPDSVYKKEILFYLDFAEQNLAEYEENVGDWYSKGEAYFSAANRYEYVMKNFPNYAANKRVARKLIYTYNKNQEKQKAKDALQAFIKIYNANPE